MIDFMLEVSRDIYLDSSDSYALNSHKVMGMLHTRLLWIKWDDSTPYTDRVQPAPAQQLIESLLMRPYSITLDPSPLY